MDLTGTTLAHYRITAVIGAGGMGRVCRATDTKLGRDVALKVLPGEMASNPDRLERIQREAQALAALDHPGVVIVYSIEETDGIHFLTMQLIDGTPIDRLVPEGGLPGDQVVEIGIKLAEALAAAHAKGIIHRDLKPACVMVTTEGRVKVLDFGLAKLTDTDQEVSGDLELPTLVQTREGVVIRTELRDLPAATKGTESSTPSGKGSGKGTGKGGTGKGDGKGRRRERDTVCGAGKGGRRVRDTVCGIDGPRDSAQRFSRPLGRVFC
ncbi:MAG: serine/threonine protein kinase [Acidobacteriota bacterium]|nr:MAG: serine/threonine protein kinase [Acidobacteriota bacterium]